MERMLTVPEVADLLKLHRVTVRRFLLSGLLKGLKAGARKWLVKESSLTEFLEKKQPEPGELK